MQRKKQIKNIQNTKVKKDILKEKHHIRKVIH
jgi:hypothetical protein